MRIGLVTPRLNGIVSLGGLGGPDLLGQVTSYFNSFMNSLETNLEHGMAATPDVVAETLTQAVKDSCAAVAPTPCDPTSVAPQIAAYIQQYTDAYNKARAALAQNVQAGLVTVPSSYVPPTPSTSQVQYSSQPMNALDRVTPQTATVTTPTPVNALSPPQAPAPVSAQNAGTFTGTSTTATGPGPAVSVSGGFGIPTWASSRCRGIWNLSDGSKEGQIICDSETAETFAMGATPTRWTNPGIRPVPHPQPNTVSSAPRGIRITRPVSPR